MSTRTLPAVALVACLAGCGKPPGDAPAGPTLAIGETPSAGRSEQKRAVAGKEKATVGPITAEVLGWEVKKRKDVEGADAIPGQEECVAIRVRFSTTDDTVKRSTGEMLFAGSECKDEFGNGYKFDTWSPRLKGDEFTKDVTSESPVTRLVLVQKPIPKANRFDLDLSASFVGVGKGEKFRFTIPLK